MIDLKLVLLLNIFILGLQAQSTLTCRERYTCLTLRECGARHSKTPTNEILFACDTKASNKFCCPPTSEQRISEKPVKLSLLDHEHYKLFPETDICGQTQQDKIQEGQDAIIGQFPWMALLGFKFNNGSIIYSCGGSLINDRYVLTAAHCVAVSSFYIRLDHVRLGELDLSKARDCDIEKVCQDIDDVPVEQVIIHDGWDEKTLKNDIALLRLARSSVNPVKNISPLCLPFNISNSISDESQFTIAGWGKQDWKDHGGSKVLQFATIDGVNKADCQICQESRPPQYCPIDNSQVCVQGVRGIDVCKGDSGGPLMTTKSLPVYQIGITSFKPVEECGEDNIPSIFTRVEHYLPWILDKIRA